MQTDASTMTASPMMERHSKRSLPLEKMHVLWQNVRHSSRDSTLHLQTAFPMLHTAQLTDRRAPSATSRSSTRQVLAAGGLHSFQIHARTLQKPFKFSLTF